MVVTKSFPSMDVSTPAQWERIFETGTRNHPRVAERVLWLLESQAGLNDGFAIDQLAHGLQTAARAERADADDELVVAALCHDIGKGISVANHAATAADILRPYVRDEVYRVVAAHQDFTSRYSNQHFGRDVNCRDQWREESWYEMAETFADEWDQASFDPAYDTPTLDRYEPLVRRIFGNTPSVY